MTSETKPEADRPRITAHLAELIKRRGELLPEADDAHVLSELTSIDRQIREVSTGARAYDLAA
jgi:hypothetical protein